MKSTLFTRGKTRREPAGPPNVAPSALRSSRSSNSSNSKKKRDNVTPASDDDSSVYFDNTPRVTQQIDDDGSRPPPSNPEAISLASSSVALSRSGRTGPTTTVRPSSPPLQRGISTRVPPKININTFWAANEEFERKYDLTPVHQDGEGDDVGGSASFTVDPWEHSGSSRRDTSSGR